MYMLHINTDWFTYALLYYKNIFENKLDKTIDIEDVIL